MHQSNWYLRNDVIIEPLIHHWYAWHHLCSPMTAGLLIQQRYVPILKSFLQHPELHFAIFKEKKYSAGPYVNLSPSEIERVQVLLDILLTQGQSLIDIAKAILSVAERLAQVKDGMSLEQFYQTLPPPLAGCVELVYDLNHQATARLLERHLYTKFYDRTNQSLGFMRGHERKNILGTPRLDPFWQQLNLAFDDTRLDQLMKLRDQPISSAALTALLAEMDAPVGFRETFFTENRKSLRQQQHAQSQQVRVKYFGHACVLIETDDIAILIDPIINYYENESATFTFDDLPAHLDYVLITHAHQDHFCLEVLLQLRYKVKTIVVPANNRGFLADPSMKLMLIQCGFVNVCELEHYDEIALAEGVIKAIPFFGEHGDLDIQSKLAYYIKLKDETFLLAADSNNVDNELYAHIRQQVGQINTVFIGMECVGAPYSWGYNHLLWQKPSRTADQSRRLNGSDCAKACKIIQQLEPQRVVIYAMGMEPHLHYILGLSLDENSEQLQQAKALQHYCKENHIDCFRPYQKQEWTCSSSR